MVITGAAGDIGAATATAFSREGASLVLVDLPHTVTSLEERSDQLRACGAHRVVVFSADMRQEEEVQAMVTHTLKTLGEQWSMTRLCAHTGSHCRPHQLLLQ